MLNKVNQTIQNYYGYEDYHAVTLTVSAMQQTVSLCPLELAKALYYICLQMQYQLL